VIAAKKELWRELNELNDQILHLEKVNTERLAEIDRVCSEMDQIKRQNKVTSNN